MSNQLRDGWTQKQVCGAHFGGYHPFKVETLKSGYRIITDSRGYNALGFSRISNRGAFIPTGDLNSVVAELNT